MIQSLSHPSFASHIRAVLVIAHMDWRHFWRYPLNLISYVFQPLIWLAPVIFLGQAFSINGQALGFAGYSGTSDYISFVLLGTILTNFVQSVFWGIGYALKRDMDTGVLESNWLTPMPRPLMLIGRTFSSLFTTSLVALIILAVSALLFGFQPTGSALMALVPVVPMLIGLYGFGIAFASIVLLMRDANTLVDMGSFLVTLFSGSQFPVQALPRWLMPVSLALPLTYGFDAVRGFLLKTTTIIPLQYEVALLVVFMFVMLWLGVIVFNRMERKVRSMGTLGQH